MVIGVKHNTTLGIIIHALFVALKQGVDGEEIITNPLTLIKVYPVVTRYRLSIVVNSRCW